MTRNELFFSLILATSITPFLFLIFVSCHAGFFLQVFPFFFHCCHCIWNFHCLRHWIEFVNETVVSHRIHPFCKHRNFQLSSSGFDCELELFIVWFDEVCSSPLSLSSFGFSMAHLCFAFFLAASDIRVHYLAIRRQDEKYFVFL